MIDAVFISDLHLHPEEPLIQKRFEIFIDWARTSVKNLYILGDFFCTWPGDDSINEWSLSIATLLFSLKKNNISVYFLKGNRDFLLGKKFAELAGWTELREPTLINLGGEQVLLVHGDGYCTKDKAHQRFRVLTRNRLFSAIFLSLPLGFRTNIVNKIRALSTNGPGRKSIEIMDVVPQSVLSHMKEFKVTKLIHGHTHKPGLTSYEESGEKFQRFVLSDWDDNPILLCYDVPNGLCFKHVEMMSLGV